MPVPDPLPEPLQQFDAAASAVRDALARIDAALDRYDEMRDSGAVLANSVEALRVELTYHSNAIEGSTLSLRETQLILEGLTPAPGRSLREVYEARNHDRALRMIERWAEQRDTGSPVTEQDVLDAHGAVMADIEDEPPRGFAGRYRKDRVLIKGTRFVPPGAHRFGELMPALMALAKRGGVHPVLQAAELHYNVVAVHPFTDGNGRTARLMMNYFLLARGYPLTIVEVERRGEYLAALEEANAGRCGAFAGFIAGCVERSIGRVTG